MRLAYVTTYDPTNVHEWSGIGFYLLKSLQDAGCETEVVGNLKDEAVPFADLKRTFYARFLKQRYHKNREKSLLKSYAQQVSRALANSNCDVIFSPGTIPIAYLETHKPMVFWADATFAGMINFYPSFTNLCRKTLRDGNRMEQMVLSKCRLAIYASEWAAASAVDNYVVDAAKVKVVPFGANINSTRTAQEIEGLIERKSFDTCKLLFLGVDWHRKGGDVAVSVAKLLTERGRKTQLDIVGCKPFVDPPPFVRQHGFISKRETAGAEALERLIAEAHFLVLPSKAECYGIVFAEASSFGLPALTTRSGGIPTAVCDGKNGRTFSLDAQPSEYCDFIETLMNSKETYRKLALTTYHEYIDRLNWATAGQRVVELIQRCC